MPTIHIDSPAWVEGAVEWERLYTTDQEKMRLALDLARENTVRGTGGPFAAAVFQRDAGRLVSVGVNSVVRLDNCTLHAEMVAIMMAQARLGCFTLRARSGPAHELVTSCDPCAMCLGATLWSGVERVVCGAAREDALRLRFEEGPVFPESHAYLESRGIEIVRGVLREEATGVLELYRERGGPIYNG